MPSQGINSALTKIYQLVFGLGILFVGFSVTRGMMSGNKTTFFLVVAFSIVSSLLLRLDKYYWVFAAFLFGNSNGRSLPFIRFSGGELGSIIIVCMYFVRQALHRDVVRQQNLTFVAAAIPFMTWFCLVWAFHPAGLFILGGSSMGGRFYFLVALAFLAMFCFSKISLGERESKLLVIAVCLGYLSFVLDVLFKGGLRSILAGGNRSHYEVLRLSFIAPVFLCRFSIPELLLHPRALVPFMACFGLSIWSGNRTAAARTALVGLLAPVFLKRNRAGTFALFFVVAFILGFVLLGQGRVWNLPYSVQRSLSFLPAKWTDKRIHGAGFRDDFRAEMRRLARVEIERNPWFGRGGFATDLNEAQLMFFINSGSGSFGEGHAFAGNWHNVWLGFAADFGIPLSVAWALFMGCFLVYGYRKFPRITPGSWAQTAYLYFYLLGVVEFLNSFFNGGHTSFTPALFFPWAGMMMAVLNGNERVRFAKPPR